MIQVRKSKHYLWRNVYALRPVFVADLTLGEYFEWTTAALAEPLAKILLEQWPDLPHAREPVDAARLVAELALRLQLVGDISQSSCGVHARDPEKQTATVFFSCMDNFLAEVNVVTVTRLVTLLAKRVLSTEQLAASIREFISLAERVCLDQSTRAMIGKAEQRDIPWFRISAASRHVQLGQGSRQRRIFETLTSADSPMGRNLARNKLLTYDVLSQVRLPVGRYAAVGSVGAALHAAERIGYPVVLKPAQGEKGRGVHANLRTPEELKVAFAKAGGRGQMLLQSFFPGDDHRLLIIEAKLIAAARRMAASVTGDGRSTIADLVAQANRDPRRGPGFTRLMNFIEIDDDSRRMLAQQGFTLQSILKPGEQVRLKSAANISQGGMAVDVTDIIHPDNASAAVKAAKVLELKVAGVDFISPDISKSWCEVGGGICEANSIVGLRPHWLADPKRDVVGPIIDTIYPQGENGRIPTAMITGTKGKSTTTFMLRRILECAGHTVGAVTTDGVTVGDEIVAVGDYAGTKGAAMVLRDPTVTAAVLETARGGIIKSGIYLDWCDAAALLNVRREQIGMDGVETVEDMAVLKRKVLETARKAVVLNADDALCAAMVPEFARTIRTILFSMDSKSSLLAQHVANGGDAVVLREVKGKEVISIESKSGSTPLVAAVDLPATMNGLIRANVFNAVAATALALGLEQSPDHIREGLNRHDTSLEKSGGRFSLVNGFPIKIMFDRAAHATSLGMLVPVTDAIPTKGKRICAITVVGNRPDWVYSEAMTVVAGHFDRYICYECEDYLRGRNPGELGALMAAELQKAGVKAESIAFAESNADAARLVAREAGADDFVAVLGINANSVEEYRAAFREAGR